MNDSDYYDLMRIPMRARKDAEAILFELEERPDGLCTTTARLADELLGRGGDAGRYLFDLDRALGLLAENHGLLLDRSHHDGLVEGLPYNLDFYVWHRENAEENGMFSADPELAKLGYRYAYGDVVATAIAELLARALPAPLVPTELSFYAEHVPACDAIILDVWCPFSIGDAEFELRFTLYTGDGGLRCMDDPLPEPSVEDVELTCEYCDEDFEEVCARWDDERGVWTSCDPE